MYMIDAGSTRKEVDDFVFHFVTCFERYLIIYQVPSVVVILKYINFPSKSVLEKNTF